MIETPAITYRIGNPPPGVWETLTKELSRHKRTMRCELLHVLELVWPSTHIPLGWDAEQCASEFIDERCRSGALHYDFDSDTICIACGVSPNWLRGRLEEAFKQLLSILPEGNKPDFPVSGKTNGLFITLYERDFLDILADFAEVYGYFVPEPRSNSIPGARAFFAKKKELGRILLGDPKAKKRAKRAAFRAQNQHQKGQVA